jgi:hypothetical protein
VGEKRKEKLKKFRVTRNQKVNSFLGEINEDESLLLG